MKVVAQHPCPVRWLTPRGRSQIAYLALRTPVEIPEVDSGTLGRDFVEFTLHGLPRRFPLHAGKLWRPAQVHAHYAPAQAATAASTLAEHLADRTGVPSGVGTPGSPLCGSMLEGVETGLHGTDLPDEALAGAVTDHTHAVRESFRAWAATELLIEDGKAYAAVGVPALTPFRGAGRHNVVDQAPRDLSLGLVVEPARIRHMRQAFTSLRFKEPSEPPGNTLQSYAFQNAFGHVPDSRRDLSTFANAGPRQVLQALVRAAPRIDAGDMEILERHVGALSPYAELGLVGAVGEDRHHEAISRMIDALDALTCLSPRGYAPVASKRLRSFAVFVASPALRSAPVPVEDLDDLSTLAP